MCVDEGLGQGSVLGEAQGLPAAALTGGDSSSASEFVTLVTAALVFAPITLVVPFDGPGGVSFPFPFGFQVGSLGMDLRQLPLGRVCYVRSCAGYAET